MTAVLSKAEEKFSYHTGIEQERNGAGGDPEGAAAGIVIGIRAEQSDKGTGQQEKHTSQQNSQKEKHPGGSFHDTPAGCDVFSAKKQVGHQVKAGIELDGNTGSDPHNAVRDGPDGKSLRTACQKKELVDDAAGENTVKIPGGILLADGELHLQEAEAFFPVFQNREVGPDAGGTGKPVNKQHAVAKERGQNSGIGDSRQPQFQYGYEQDVQKETADGGDGTFERKQRGISVCQISFLQAEKQFQKRHGSHRWHIIGKHHVDEGRVGGKKPDDGPSETKKRCRRAKVDQKNKENDGAQKTIGGLGAGLYLQPGNEPADAAPQKIVQSLVDHQDGGHEGNGGQSRFSDDLTGNDGTQQVYENHPRRVQRVGDKKPKDLLFKNVRISDDSTCFFHMVSSYTFLAGMNSDYDVKISLAQADGFLVLSWNVSYDKNNNVNGYC